MKVVKSKRKMWLNVPTFNNGVLEERCMKILGEKKQHLNDVAYMGEK